MTGRGDPFRRLRWARGQQTGAKALKALLLVIATYADEHGECRPALKTLAADTEQSIDSVRRQLGELVAGGFIVRFARYADSGRQLTDGIIIPFDEAAAALAALRVEEGRMAKQGLKPRRPRPEQPRLPLEEEPPRERHLSTVDTVDKPVADPPFCQGGGSTGARGGVAAVLPLERPKERPKERPPTPQGGSDGDCLQVEDQTLWERFEARYPWDVTDPPVRAKRVFLALPPGERALAVEHVGRYVAECQARGRKLMHGANWLKAKGWEPFARAGPGATTGAAALENQVWIRRNTPEWLAWDAYERSRSGRGLPATESKGRGWGWWRPTRWPPGHVAAARPPPTEVEPRAMDG